MAAALRLGSQLSTGQRRGGQPYAPGQCLLVVVALLLVVIASDVVPARAFTAEQEALFKAAQGAAALSGGQYVDADNLLTETLKSSALSSFARARALSDRGVGRWRLSYLRAAIEDFNAAITLVPEHAPFYNNRGNVLVELELYAEAIKDFNQAILLAPAYGAAFNNRGNARLWVGDYDKAVADFNKAIDLIPDNAVPFNGRGKAQLVLRRAYGAIRDFSRAIVLDKRYAQAYANRAEAFVARGRYREGVQGYTDALRYSPTTAAFYFGRGRTYALLDRQEVALDDLDKAISLDPSLAAAFAERGALYHKVGRFNDAKADLDRALTLDPGLPAALAYNTRLLVSTGEPEAARVKVPEASRFEQKKSLGLQVSDEVKEAFGRLAAVGQRMYRAHMGQGRKGPSRLAPADRSGDESRGAELEGWKIELTRSGDYVAKNSEHPSTRIPLEMYGSGKPELLSWHPLEGELRGIGLLRYYAGTSSEGERLEYTALADTEAGKLLAIEPAQWGERKAKWSWSKLAVVVEDPQGVPSVVQVRQVPTYEAPASVRSVKRRAVAEHTSRRVRSPERTSQKRESVLPNATGLLQHLFR